MKKQKEYIKSDFSTVLFTKEYHATLQDVNKRWYEIWGGIIRLKWWTCGEFQMLCYVEMAKTMTFLKVHKESRLKKEAQCFQKDDFYT